VKCLVPLLRKRECVVLTNIKTYDVSLFPDGPLDELDAI